MLYREIAYTLEQQGHEVTSQWIYEGLHKDFSDCTPEELLDIAQRDKSDVYRADLVALDTTSPLSEGSGGGKEWELGFSHGLRKGARVGPARNPFHYLTDEVFNNWREFLEWAQKQA